MTPLAILVLFLVATVALIALIVAEPEVTRTITGKALAFTALFVLPAIGGWAGFDRHMESSKETQFCLSCHIMAPYGQSLYVDANWVPASHFQNNRVPRERACFTCHTTYTLYGDYKAKIRGFRHLWAEYVTGPRLPIHLYQPYNNRECLHCHGEARVFLENAIHSAIMQDLRNDSTSCLSCHEPVHNVSHLSEVNFWKPK
jgi:cytochrome c nitrite reductase small subunit